ncbi:1-deoxy-D-xylulose 5-phosphate reductoisomerase [Desulfovibrio sp. X2]|uniref:1-deoxy-D-xylulose-5-phosphate reductoisomerase n=1 Tax=Desulfovibrio sp. X2 TaxID=941449 RepID=UPI000358A1E9|nr:1-deoxy-D-xylulose-5-phosphate reductoisomerase [Desulfovibrio sp. X2]EPR44359.1 1-deoxy-D-xylulose 5-phosphate reductoisomerase [Desulfovibrio sp. X2]
MHSVYISPIPERTPCRRPRSLAVLGSTGSIGTQALDVVEEHPERFEVVALAAGRNAELLARQAIRHRPGLLAVLDRDTADKVRALLPAGYAPRILAGPEAYVEAATLPEAEMVLSSIVGAAGLPPTFAAVAEGKMVALANKESLVLAGHLIREACCRSRASILPVDSEHNALFQAFCFESAASLRRLVLTASGGPFRGRDKAFLEQVTPEQALAHPNWSMGAKISVDSATLMNKGLEVIEACHLYGLPEHRVATVVHPQSIVHSLAEYVDGSLLAHLGPPDMRVAIAYCLCFPDRVPLAVTPVDLVRLGSLTFEEPDTELFPCLRLARAAYSASQSHPIVLNAANEVAVALFLSGALSFLGIPRLIEACLERHRGRTVPDLETVLELDREARVRARELSGV